MPEPSNELLTEGLTRLKTSLDGLPLLVAKNAPGAFPASAAGKQAARHCQERGLVRVLRRAPLGRRSVELHTISPAGDDWLLKHATPRLALEALATALSRSCDDIATSLRRAQERQDQLTALRDWIETLLTHEQNAPAPDAPLPGEIDVLIALEDWHRANPLEDCPLPELHRQIALRLPGLSIGAFHDACRRLLERGRIYVHPWTGPLYELPEPGLAFLAGHEIAYYASLRPEEHPLDPLKSVPFLSISTSSEQEGKPVATY
ncbi:MAG: hypothetical protein U0793_10485 [Gemmataceae bacterium]